MNDSTTANNFKPTFPASDLGKFCSDLSEENELKILIKHTPFNEYGYRLIGKSNIQSNKMNQTHIDFIKNELKERFSKSLRFNDELVFLILLAHIAYDTLEIGEILSENYQKNINRYISTQRGRQLEPCILRQVNEQENKKFAKKNKCLKKPYEFFIISGIPDGIDDDAKKIIEIKTRSNFDEMKISLIEEIQCMCYMELTGYKECFFVEYGPKEQNRQQELKFDQNYFDQNVVKKLTDFVMKYKNISRDEFSKLAEKYPSSFQLINQIEDT